MRLRPSAESWVNYSSIADRSFRHRVRLRRDDYMLYVIYFLLEAKAYIGSLG